MGLESIEKQQIDKRSQALSIEIEAIPAASLGVPVNKVRPTDYQKQNDCLSFIRKINKEKKLRQARIDELRRKDEEKINEQLEMNR